VFRKILQAQRRAVLDDHLGGIEQLEEDVGDAYTLKHLVEGFCSQIEKNSLSKVFEEKKMIPRTKYNAKEIEIKWQTQWDAQGLYLPERHALRPTSTDAYRPHDQLRLGKWLTLSFHHWGGELLRQVDNEHLPLCRAAFCPNATSTKDDKKNRREHAPLFGSLAQIPLPNTYCSPAASLPPARARHLHLGIHLQDSLHLPEQPFHLPKAAG
jgi:hypothetical protein